jgi:hypothetical protein
MLLGINFCGRLEEQKRRYKKTGAEWNEILPVEPMNWCWVDERSYWRGGWIGLVAGLLIAAILWLVVDEVRGMGVGLVVTMLTTVFSGMSGTGIARVSIEPNQGMARSLRHALLMTAVFVGAGCLSLGFIYGLKLGWVQGLVNASLGFSLAFAFYIFGGIAVIRQFSLGCILHGQGRLPSWVCWPPWKATVQFLDDLVRYKLLRHSAGGYMFRHQSLREYYRSLPAQE